jgi:hypothetical protein
VRKDLTFRHRFGADLVASITVPSEPPSRSEPFAVVSVEWEGSGKLSPKHIPAYRTWILATHKVLADRWGSRITYALQTSEKSTEMWAFEPGEEPKLVNKLPGIL